MNAAADASARPVIEVACGVLVDAAGRVLLAERPPGKVAAGKWEFPGGKLEPGESARAALARELDEELGIRVSEAVPLARLRQDYSDRCVWLDTWRIDGFDGLPRPRERQRLAWVRPEDAGRFDLLPSCWRVLAALRLPTHYVFTPPVAPLTDWWPCLHRLPRGALLRLRRPGLRDAEYLHEARVLAPDCAARGLALILDRDPQWVGEIAAAGLHLDGAALARCQQRPLTSGHWCLASAHDPATLARAQQLALDAAVLSPVQATITHPEAEPLGWDRFGRWARQAGLPVYALGGVGPSQLAAARAHGAFGIAGISAYWGAY